MTYFRSITAIIHGFILCFSNKELRKLAIRPWLIGVVCYFLSLVGAYYSHGPLLSLFVETAEGFFGTIIYYGAWVFVALLLLIASMVISLTAVMILGGPFQTALAIAVFKLQNKKIPEEEEGVKATVKEVSRTIATESTKLLWLLPLFVIVAIIGFIPFLMPFAVVVASWLLAFQFIDVPLDVLKLPTRQRIGFAARHLTTVICFGLTLSACWAVPFLGLFLPPVAVVGATWLIAESDAMKENL